MANSGSAADLPLGLPLGNSLCQFDSESLAPIATLNLPLTYIYIYMYIRSACLFFRLVLSTHPPKKMSIGIGIGIGIIIIVIIIIIIVIIIINHHQSSSLSSLSSSSSIIIIIFHHHHHPSSSSSSSSSPSHFVGMNNISNQIPVQMVLWLFASIFICD